MDSMIRVTHYLPLLTTIISTFFAVGILSRWRTKREALHLLWWGIGVVAYGVGTLIESAVTLFGWHDILLRSWYIAGALLGGAPLALGTVYLLMSRRFAHIATTGLIITVAVTSIFVILSPVKAGLVDPQILNGKVLGWQSIRLVSPFVNSFAFLFLVGGAVYTTARFIRIPASRHVAIGNIFIAIGGILPGIGGMYSRLGHTEVLYVGELVGVVFIWYGYRYCQRQTVPRADATVSVPA